MAYLNGQEIARDLVSGVTPTFDQLSDGHHNALLPDGQKPEYFKVDLDLLIEGTNIIAVQVHNQSSTSSDMTALPVLSIESIIPNTIIEVHQVGFQRLFMWIFNHLIYLS